jgi:predicted DNA-binding antitoxin AbrB/MazE fold protein
MPITVDAIYQGGVLKPSRPLPVSEHSKVRVTVDVLGDSLLHVPMAA